MALIEREVGLAVAAAAAALSPTARRVARQGAVYGVAGAMKAVDVAASTARGAAHGAQEGWSGNDAAPAPKPAAQRKPATRRSAPASTGSRSRKRGGAARTT
jgi:hypothetical protein